LKAGLTGREIGLAEASHYPRGAGGTRNAAEAEVKNQAPEGL